MVLLSFLPDLNIVGMDVALQKLNAGDEGLLELHKLALEQDRQTAQAEFMFVIDRSGSMGGARIVNLRKALVQFMQVLPQDSLFNIVSFGSTFSSLPAG